MYEHVREAEAEEEKIKKKRREEERAEMIRSACKQARITVYGSLDYAHNCTARTTFVTAILSFL